MSYQKSHWRRWGLALTEAVLTRDADLVPLLVLVHDGVVDWWESEAGQAARKAGKGVLYLDAVKAAGLEPVWKYVSNIQNQRSTGVC